MFKNDFSILDKNYSKFMYSGVMGFVMKRSHELMEKNSTFFKNKQNIKILEIGAGKNPHINFLKHEFSTYDVLDIDANNKLKKGINSFLKKLLFLIKK